LILGDVVTDSTAVIAEQIEVGRKQLRSEREGNIDNKEE